MKLTSNGLREPIDGRGWYSAGKYDVVINNWTGSVNYSEDDSPPTYSITDGTETETGTFSALSLTAPKNLKSNLKNRIKSLAKALQNN
jgi:hypothetical protein